MATNFFLVGKCDLFATKNYLVGKSVISFSGWVSSHLEHMESNITIWNSLFHHSMYIIIHMPKNRLVSWVCGSFLLYCEILMGHYLCMTLSNALYDLWLHHKAMKHQHFKTSAIVVSNMETRRGHTKTRWWHIWDMPHCVCLYLFSFFSRDM